MVYYLDNVVSPAAIQSGKELQDEFIYWMNNARAESVNLVKVSIAAVDEEALRTYAGRHMNSECTTSYVIAAGAFNIVYFLGFSHGREAIARVNKEEQTSDQTLLRDRVVSEASTLRYIKTHLSVPVPTVYYVNHKLPHPVGGRFIIEERVLGRQLSLRACTRLQRTAICTQLFHREAELISARFTAIGSIYQDPQNDTFYVGPMGPSVCRPLNHTVDRGPWTSTRDWLKAYVKSELSGILADPEKYREYRKERYELDNGNPPFAYHVAWLKTLLATMDELQYLNNIPSAVERPVLFHEDLSGGNVLCSYPDPTILAGIIDFEGARVVPLWSALNDPTSFTDGWEDTDSLLKSRMEILCKADPACAQAQSYREPLCLLRWLVSMGITIWCSTDNLRETYLKMREVWPIHEPAFAALDKLISLDPAVYCKDAEPETT